MVEQLDPYGTRFFPPRAVAYRRKPTASDLITENSTSHDLEWGYILHDQGIEVISLNWDDRGGPLVGWETSPLARIRSIPSLWGRDQPPPVQDPAPRVVLPNSPPSTAQVEALHRRIVSLKGDLVRAHEAYEPGTVSDPPQADLVDAFDQFAQAVPEIIATVRTLASLSQYEAAFLRDLEDIAVTPVHGFGTAARIDPLAWWLTQGGEGLIALARRHLPAPRTETPLRNSAAPPARPPRSAQSTPSPRR